MLEIADSRRLGKIPDARLARERHPEATAGRQARRDPDVEFEASQARAPEHDVALDPSVTPTWPNAEW